MIVIFAALDAAISFAKAKRKLERDEAFTQSAKDVVSKALAKAAKNADH